MVEYGTDLAPPGAANVYGVRPGKASFQYEGPLWDQELHILIYLSNHEAMAKVLPPPLEIVPELPPIVMFVSWDTDHMQLADGRRRAYTGVSFNVACKYKDTVGQHCAFEYMDGPGGDKTAGAEMIMVAGQNQGFNKKLGDVNILPYGDEHIVTVDRLGTRLATARFSGFQDMPAENEGAMDPKIDAVLKGATLGVREVPKVDHSGYDLRSVVTLGHAWGNVRKMAAGQCELELGHLELDPVDILKVETPLVALKLIQDVPKEIWTGAREIERLPLETE